MDCCITPNLHQVDNKDFIDKICRTRKHAECIHLSSLEEHFKSVVDVEREKKRMKEFFKYSVKFRGVSFNSGEIVQKISLELHGRAFTDLEKKDKDAIIKKVMQEMGATFCPDFDEFFKKLPRVV
jgi:hypothetical protein